MYKRKTHAYISFVYMYSLMYINRHIHIVEFRTNQTRWAKRKWLHVARKWCVFISPFCHYFYNAVVQVLPPPLGEHGKGTIVKDAEEPPRLKFFLWNGDIHQPKTRVRRRIVYFAWRFGWGGGVVGDWQAAGGPIFQQEFCNQQASVSSALTEGWVEKKNFCLYIHCIYTHNDLLDPILDANICIPVHIILCRDTSPIYTIGLLVTIRSICAG